ncbi:MAG: hypothetical protein KAH20_12455 [Methylococcales bacterium]|nr:hypothetical protein [Methylococcales bacterium]
MFLKKANTHHLFFGHYEKPDLLLKLESFQNKGNSWGNLGFHIHYDYHYYCTPLDTIPFAGTGGNGTHFCFLTDFGTMSDLNNTNIVCVSPLDDPPVKLVAKNLKDFLHLVITLGIAEFLDYMIPLPIEDRIEQLAEWDAPFFDLQGNPDPDMPELSHTRAELVEILKTDFQTTPMPNANQYTQNLRAKRQTEITIQTDDNIGIIYQTEKLALTSFDYNNTDENEIKDYLINASNAEKLKFYRDATYHYILSKGYDIKIKKIIIEALKKDGFPREAQLLHKKY